MLRESEHLEEQGDILQYLIDTQGMDFKTGNTIKFLIYIKTFYILIIISLESIFY